MTVVSALIIKHGTAHASDSYITQAKVGGGRAVIEDQKTKLIYVKHWRGAMGYWGLAQYLNWSTLDWLESRAQTASQFSDPEEFANALALDLNSALASLPLTPLEKGIGIHFTAYERIKDYWVPELFLISNWQGIPYCGERRQKAQQHPTKSTLQGLSNRSIAQHSLLQSLPTPIRLRGSKEIALFSFSEDDARRKIAVAAIRDDRT